jgi:TonB-linked SusC/RagA family outer membrane protein
MQKRITNEWGKAAFGLLLLCTFSGPVEAARLNGKDQPAKQIASSEVIGSKRLLDVRVTGKIVASGGEAMPGVTVLVKGTQVGTSSNVDGTYTLNVPDENSVLVFSLIGYVKQEVTVGNRTNINISLVPDVKALSEVLVVGYGTQERKDVTGSVANVRGEQLLDRQPVSVTQALQGRVAGVDVYTNTARPGAQSRVRVRGINSINTNIDPLYVVDGVIGVSPDALDPNNIESIDVLKDASSTAIYGARGANGVIIVTTKRGLEGKSLVSYNTFGSYSVPARSVPNLNAREYMEIYNRAYDNTAKYDPEGFAAGKYVRNDPKNFPNLFDANGNPLYDTNWEKEVYGPAFAHNHHLSVQGGAEKTQYSVSVGFIDQDGIMRNSGFQRYNAKFTLDNQVRDWLRIGGTITGLKTKEKEVDDGSGGLNVPRMVSEALPILPIKYPNGTWARNSDWPGMEGGENPVRLTEEKERRNNRNELLGDIYAAINLTQDLEFRSSFGYNLVNRKNNYYSGRDVNGFSANQKGQADIFSAASSYWQSENYFTYNKKLFGNHQLTGLLGLSWMEWYEESMSASTQGFIDDFWGWHNLGVGTVRSGISSGDSRWAMNSYFGRLNYNIADKYMFTVTGRYDGSSKFGKNNKYALFPSIGAAWRISEEGFFNSAAITNLKLRTSAGSTGNSEIGSFASLQFLGTEQPLLDGGRQTGIFRSSFGNPDLKWEVTNQYDLGLDLGLFDNRVELMADLYYKRTNDLLLNAPIPWSSGLESVTQNIGSVENKGIELALNTVNITRGNFTWNTSLNWSSNRNKVLQLGINNDDIFPGPWFLGQTNILRVGESIGSLWGYKRLGTWGTNEADEAAKFNRLPGDLKWEDVNKDGKLDASDEGIIGRSYPKGTMNVSNTFKYRDFDFTFDIRFVYGVNTVNATKHSVEDRQGIASGMATIMNAWRPDNQNTHIAEVRHYNAGYDTHMDDWWAEDGSFIRGQNFILGYNLPAVAAQKIRLQGLRVYASAQNLFLITDYSGYDPEATTFGGQLTQNIEFFQYPKPRTFNMGLNVSF